MSPHKMMDLAQVLHRAKSRSKRMVSRQTHPKRWVLSFLDTFLTVVYAQQKRVSGTADHFFAPQTPRDTITAHPLQPPSFNHLRDRAAYGMHDRDAATNHSGWAWKPDCLQTRKPAFVRPFSYRVAAPSMAGRVGPASAGPVPVGRFPPPRRSATRRGKREWITHRITGAVIMRQTTSDPVSVADRPASSSSEHPHNTLRFHPEAEQALRRLASR